MKLFSCALFLLLSLAAAQRSRLASPSELETNPRGSTRGRARFALSPETAPVVEAEKPRRIPQARRAPVASLERRAPTLSDATLRRTYEVEEVFDDTPQETYRRPGKPRVFTESRFEAKNAPPTHSLFQPSTTLSVEELLKDIGSGIADVAATSAIPSTYQEVETAKVEDSSSEATKNENEIKQDLTRSQEVTTPSTTARVGSREPLRRVIVRGRSNSIVPQQTEATSTAASRARSRSRPYTRSKPDEAPAEQQISRSASTAAPGRTRASRRKPEASSEAPKPRGGPSVFVQSEEAPLRSRTGRKIGVNRRPIPSSAPEKLTIDLNPSVARVESSRRRPSSTAAPSTTATTEKEKFRARVRSRSRFRDVPPIIDEQKLEVLPLFEGETKTVPPRKSVKFVARRKLHPTEDGVQTSATENDIKVSTKPSYASTRAPSYTSEKSVNIETSTESSFKRRPVVKESVVVSEVSEVTSKRTVGRKTLPPAEKYKRIKVDEPKVSVSQVITRGRKKAEFKPKKKGLTSSEEDIEDSDNYPEAFKALLHAKKHKESRPSHLDEAAVTKTTERIVTSSIQPATIRTTASTTTTTTEASRQVVQDLENELDPIKPLASSTTTTLRPTRRKFTSHPHPTKVTEKSTIHHHTLPTRSKVVRATTPYPRDNKFHARYNTIAKSEVEATPPTKSGKSFSPKPPRGLYSSRKEVSKNTKSPTASTQLPTSPAKKSSRYSSRYRTDLARSSRTSTSAPAYLPTIPTITPPTTSEYVWPEEENNEYGWSFSRLH